MRWQPFPLVGGAYSDDARPWSAQDCVNYIPVYAERPGGRSPAMLRGLPGYRTIAALEAAAPIRGLHDAEGRLLAVCGRTLYTVSPDGLGTALGTIPDVGRVSMAHNQITGGNEVVIATGASGYVYNTKAGSLAQIADAGFPGAKVVDFVDGYIVGVEPFGRFWFNSDLAAATEYNTLDRAEAESAPDRIVTLIVTHRDVLVLGERTGEFFYNSGASTGTFQRRDGTEMEVGCGAAHSVCRLDNSVIWLGHDGIVYRLEGYQPRRISTQAIEQAIAGCVLRNAFAFTFEDRGHKVYYLTFPDGHTWGYDVATGEWHRRASKGLERWRLNALVRSNGRWIGGDMSNGRLYALDWDVQSEAGAEMTRRRITGVLHDEQNPIAVNAVELVFDTGRAAPAAPVSHITIAGTFPDAYLGSAYRAKPLSATGGLPSYTWSASTQPAGLAMAPSGEVSGVPQALGVTPFDVTATDARDATATAAKSIRVLFAPALGAYRAVVGGYEVGIYSGDTAAYAYSLGTGLVFPTTTEARVAFGASGEFLVVTQGTVSGVRLYRRNVLGGYSELAGALDVAPTGFTYAAAFSPDASYLFLSDGVSGRIYHRTGDAFTQVHVATAPQAIQSAKWSPDGQYVTFSHNGAPYRQLLRLQAGAFTAVDVAVNQDGYGSAWSRTGSLLAFTARNLGVRIFHVDGATATLVHNTDAITMGEAACRWSADGAYLYLGGNDATDAALRVYRWTGTALVRQPDPPQPATVVRGLDLSIDGGVLAVAGTSAVTLYRVSGATLTPLDTPDLAAANTLAAAFVLSSDHWQP